MSESHPPISARSRLTPDLRRRVAILAILALVLSFVLSTGIIRSSTGQAEGTQLVGAPTTAPTTRKTLRVATFNIHSGVGSDNRFDLNRTAAALRGFDIVGLNEVRGPSLFGAEDQARRLAAMLSMPHLYAPAERQWWHDTFGNAVLCKLPVAAWLRVPMLHSVGRGYKNYIELRMQVGGTPLTVMVTHIDRERDRVGQLDSIFDRFTHLPAPAILMGDLNTEPSDQLVLDLLSGQRSRYGPFPSAPPGPPGPPRIASGLRQLGPAIRMLDPIIDPFASLQRPDRVDWILLRGLKLRACDAVDTNASDHPLYWVEVELP